MVIGLEPVSQGSIAYRGGTVDTGATDAFVPTSKRNVGIVLDSYAIWPHMTVAENVTFPLQVRRMESLQIREGVSQILDEVGLAGYERHPADGLCDAEQLRVAIARAIVFKPALVLLDDPFAPLDAKTREAMRAEFRVLQRKLGLTVLLAIRDPVDALSISDRIAVMDHGRIEQMGHPAELYHQPLTANVRDLFGRPVSFDGIIDGASAVGAIGVRLHDQAGPLVHARSLDADVRNGDRCLLTTRPEHVVVEPLESSSNADALNTIQGVISTLLFMGERYEAAIELPWGDDVVVSLAPDKGWREGQPVAIRLTPENLRVWPVPHEAVDAFAELDEPLAEAA
jgi:ABC-type Fe3+/spermidine/putrescine transport system ATPase subunit